MDIVLRPQRNDNASSNGRRPQRQLLADVDRLLAESASNNALSLLNDIEQALVEAERQSAFLKEELLLMPVSERRQVLPLLRARLLLTKPHLHYVIGELAGLPMRPGSHPKMI